MSMAEGGGMATLKIPALLAVVTIIHSLHPHHLLSDIHNILHLHPLPPLFIKCLMAIRNMLRAASSLTRPRNLFPLRLTCIHRAIYLRHGDAVIPALLVALHTHPNRAPVLRLLQGAEEIQAISWLHI